MAEQPSDGAPVRPRARRRKTKMQKRIEQEWGKSWRDLLREMASIGMSDAEIGARLAVDSETIRRWRIQLHIAPLVLRRVKQPRAPGPDLPISRPPLGIVTARAPSRW